MTHDDLASRCHRERRRCAVLAAALLTLVSAYGLVLSLSPPNPSPATEARADALLMSAALIAVSCAGIVATARPSQCIGLLSPGRRTDASRAPPEDPDSPPSFRPVAHHCSCGRFAGHTLRVGERTFCAGCLGMAAGGACGLGLAVALGAGLLFLDGTAGLAAILLGAAVSAGGLAQLYRQSPPGLHVAANLAFVAGAVLLAALLSTHGIVAGVFGLLAALALVGLRIEMSRWRHLSVYAECPWQGTCRGASALEAARRATRQ